MNSILEPEIGVGAWTQAELIEQELAGDTKTTDLMAAFGAFTSEGLSEKCDDHKVTLTECAIRALRRRVDPREFNRLMNEKVLESLGCTACSVAKSGDNPIEGYEMSNKRFCARCECIVAYNHRCAPKLQYLLSEAK